MTTDYNLIAAHGKDYWKRFVDHPPIVAIECIK